METESMKTLTRIRRWFAVALLFAINSMCSVQATETVTYYYTSQQGTPLATADASGNTLATSDYRPYGAQVLGTPPTGPGYTGHVNDPDSGLVYMQARYYDPIGRLLSPDPSAPKPGDVFTFNRFAYSNDNPVTNIDPDGRVVVINGSPNDVAAFQALTYRMTGMQTTSFNGTLVQMGQTNTNVGFPGAAAQLGSAINSRDTVTINAVQNDKKTLVDSFVSNTVDSADFGVLEGKSPQFAAAAFTHFLAERLYDAANGSGGKSNADFSAAHASALSPEANIMGASTRAEVSNPYPGGTETTFNYLDPSGKITSSYSIFVDASQGVH